MTKPRSAKSATPRSASASRYASVVSDEASGLRKRADEVSKNNVSKDFPFPGSKTAAALAKIIHEPLDINPKDIQEELQNDTGDCLAKLTFYDVIASNAPSGSGTTKGVTGHYVARNKTILYAMLPDVTDTTKYYGEMVFDERATAMTSVAASLVLCDILHKVKCEKFIDPNGQKSKLIYLEDLITYIQTHYGDVISLDDSKAPNTPGALRSLVKRLVGYTKTNTATFEAAIVAAGTATATAKSNFATSRQDERAKVYASEVKEYTLVTSVNVGKTWASEHDATKKDANFVKIYEELIKAVKGFLEGSPRITWAVNSKLDFDISSNEAQEAAANVLALIAANVITYSLTASLDLVYKLAKHAGKVSFEDVVLPYTVHYPHLLAALKLYGISASTFDDANAVQINTVDAVKKLFQTAHEAYDEVKNSGSRRYVSKEDETPDWMKSREERMEDEKKWDRTLRIKAASAAAPALTMTDANAAAAAKGRAAALAASANYYPIGSSTFGRRRKSARKTSSRKVKKSAFGARRKSKKSSRKMKKSSFGAKRKSSRKHKKVVKRSSFGAKRKTSIKRKTSHRR